MADTTENERAPQARDSDVQGDREATAAQGEATAVRRAKRKGSRSGHSPLRIRKLEDDELAALLRHHDIEPSEDRCNQLRDALIRFQRFEHEVTVSPTPKEWSEAFEQIEEQLRSILDQPKWVRKELFAAAPSEPDRAKIIRACLQAARKLKKQGPDRTRGAGRKRESSRGSALRAAVEPLWLDWAPGRGPCQLQGSKREVDPPGVRFLCDVADLLGLGRFVPPSRGSGRPDWITSGSDGALRHTLRHAWRITPPKRERITRDDEAGDGA